jgi:hypothetical protein
MCVNRNNCDDDDQKISRNQSSGSNRFGVTSSNGAQGDCTGAPFVGNWNMHGGMGGALTVNFATDCTYSIEACGISSTVETGAPGEGGTPLDFVNTRLGNPALAANNPNCPDYTLGGRDQCLYTVSYHFEGRNRVSSIDLDCGELGKSTLTPTTTTNGDGT